jgi:hypothetical protein
VSDAWDEISPKLASWSTKAKISSFVITSGVTTLVVPNLVTYASKITSVAVGSGTVSMSVAQATTLLPIITGSIIVSDTMEAISAKLVAYSTDDKISSIVVTSGALTSENVVSLTGASGSKVTSIVASSATMSVAQYSALSSKITGTVVVSDTLANLNTNVLLGYSTVSGITVLIGETTAETGADVQNRITDLITYDSIITSIKLSSAVTMSVTQAGQLSDDFATNGKIIVSDSWSAISGNLQTFSTNDKISSIVVTSGVTTSVVPNLLATNASKITSVAVGSGTVIMSVAQATTLLSKVTGSIIVSDTMTNISPLLLSYFDEPKISGIVITSGSPTPTDVANLVTAESKVTSVTPTLTVTMTSSQASVLQSKFPQGSIVNIALYTLSGDLTNGSSYLVTSSLCNVSLVDSSGNVQLVIDFTHANKQNTFTQSNNNTIEIDTVLELTNVSEVMFISATNQVIARARAAPASSIQNSALSIFPVVWNNIQYNFQPISIFLDALGGSTRNQSASELANLYKTRGAFTVYLQQLNTSVYSEIAADLVLKPTTENAVATFKATPAQMNSLFTINDAATPKTVTLNSTPTLESVLGKSWLDSFQITYSDLFPSSSFPNGSPLDNVITDMQKALFHVVLPTATLLPTNYTSLLADPAATVQAEYNNGIQLRALVTNYFANNAAEFHSAIQEAYTNTSSFAAFQKGDVIQWKVTMHVPLEGLGAPPGSSSGTSLSQPFSRVYLFQILVDDANFSAFDVTKYGKLVSEDDTAVGIFNTGNSNSATNKRTYPYQYVNLGNNAYVATDKNSTKYGETAFQAASGANVIGDVY